MIGLRAGGSRGGLHDVETALGSLAVADIFLGCEVARVADAARTVAQETGIDGQNDIGLIELVGGVEELAERQLRAHAAAMPQCIPLVPFGAGEKLQNVLNLAEKRG